MTNEEMNTPDSKNSESAAPENAESGKAENTEKKNPEGQAESGAECDATATEAETASAEEPAGGKKDLFGKNRKELKKAEAELKELDKKLTDITAKLSASEESRLRIAAEYDNYRRRSQKERETVYADAYADAVKGILPIIDNLELALRFGESAEAKKGIEMIIKSAVEALGKMGVCEIEAMGAPFDPTLHNAVMHKDDEALGENVICEVHQKGYKLNDRVIRFAMVTVAN